MAGTEILIVQDAGGTAELLKRAFHDFGFKVVAIAPRDKPQPP